MTRNRIFLPILVLMLVLSTFGVAVAQDELLIWADETRAPLMEELGEDFEAEFGVPVRVQEIGLPEGRDGLLTAGPVGEGPDILIVAHDSLGNLVANGAIAPFDLGGLEDEFTESSINLMSLNNQLWGLPYSMENIAFIRNVDLVPEAPATWQEVTEIASELAGDDVQGFGIQSGDTYHHQPILTAFGGYIFGLNEDGSFNVSDIGLASEGGQAAAAWLADMYANGYMSSGLGDDEIFSLFEDGQLAMFVTGPWWSQRIVDTGVNYSIDPFPGAEGVSESGQPFSGGQGFVISAFSENQLLAEQFLLDFVATEDTMQAIYDIDPRLPAFEGVDTSTDENIQSFVEAGLTALPMPAIPEMGAVWASSNDAYTLISQGEDAAATFDNAASQIVAAIETAQALAEGGRTIGLPGSHQAAVGCAGDWDPACEVTFFEDQGDGMYTLTLSIPAGDYEYKIAVNGGWDENYGVDGVAGGDNFILSLAEDTDVTFTYDDESHVVTNDAG